MGRMVAWIPTAYYSAAGIIIILSPFHLFPKKSQVFIKTKKKDCQNSPSIFMFCWTWIQILVLSLSFVFPKGSSSLPLSLWYSTFLLGVLGSLLCKDPCGGCPRAPNIDNPLAEPASAGSHTNSSNVQRTQPDSGIAQILRVRDLGGIQVFFEYV